MQHTHVKERSELLQQMQKAGYQKEEIFYILRRKYYKITQQGREAYRQARAEWADTVRILHALLEEEA